MIRAAIHSHKLDSRAIFLKFWSKGEEPQNICGLWASAFVCVCYRDEEMGSSSFVHIRGEECEERAAMND